MEEKNRGDRILDQITKTILIIILIFGLMILCGYLYLISFANRIIESERASMPTQTTVRPIDTDGWNYVDKDTMDYMQERRATEETRATQTSYSLTDEEINELLYGGH